MKPALCLCAVLVPGPSKSHVRVVIHDVELQKSTNTGRLLSLLLNNASLVPYGGPNPPLNVRCWPEGTRPVVLYPAQGAPLISSFVDPSKPPVCLIVLDGTWHQARRLRRDFLVERIPFAQLPPDEGSSVYQLRHGHFEGSRSTLEAAARALAILEGDDEAEQRLLRPFRQMVSRTLWLRGTIGAADVEGGLPPGVQRHDINTRGFADAAAPEAAVDDVTADG
jgi:DTW domain-containing protein YfiP